MRFNWANVAIAVTNLAAILGIIGLLGYAIVIVLGLA